MPIAQLGPFNLAAWAMALVMLSTSEARAEWACPEGGSPADVEANASAAFDEGEHLFSEGDYAGARDRFRCSYTLFPHRATLYNVAQSIERLGDVREAVEVYHDYLEISPESDERAQVEAHVRELEESLEDEPAVADEAPATAPQPEVPPVEPEPQTDETQPRTRQRLRSYWFWGLLGLTAGTSVIMTATGVATLRVADRWVQEGDRSDRDRALALRSTTDAFLIISICEAVATLVVGLFTDFGHLRGGETDASP